MSENMPLILTLTVLVLVIGGIAAFYIARFLRGSIKLSVPCTVFKAGDVISGSFELHAKKPVQGNRLVVSLIGLEVTRQHRNGKTRTRTQEFYRDEVVVEQGRNYPAGHQQKYDFQIKTPDTSVPEFMNSPLGQKIKAVANALGNRNSSIRWQVEARLDAKGIDLVGSCVVSINNIRTLDLGCPEKRYFSRSTLCL